MKNIKSIDTQINITETEPSLEKLPKTRFELIDLDREAELFYFFMGRGRFSSVFDRSYPELRAIQKECQNKNECIKRFREFLENLRTSEQEQILEAKNKIESEWGKVGLEFLKTLSEHFETNWPEDKEIIGFVTAMPTYPGFLDDYQFCVGYHGDTARAIETSAHEVLHFLWFKKWEEVFPEIPRNEYETPHLVWRLSEIMDPIILQCNPIIKELINPKRWGYDSFKKIKIGEVSMTEFFKKIYLDSVALGDDFATTLKKLWEEAKRHEREIDKF